MSAACRKRSLSSGVPPADLMLFLRFSRGRPALRDPESVKFGLSRALPHIIRLYDAALSRSSLVEEKWYQNTYIDAGNDVYLPYVSPTPAAFPIRTFFDTKPRMAGTLVRMLHRCVDTWWSNSPIRVPQRRFCGC